MPHAGLVAVLAKGPICRRTEPAEFRQTVRARLPRDARLGQDSARAAIAKGSDRKDFGEICRSISPPDRSRARERVDNPIQRSCHVERSETSLFCGMDAALE